MTIIDDDLLEYFRKRPCELCRAPPRSQPHHLMGRGHSGGWRLDVSIGLMSLCGICHSEHGDEPRSLQMLLGIVARREGLLGWEVVRDAIWLLRRS